MRSMGQTVASKTQCLPRCIETYKHNARVASAPTTAATGQTACRDTWIDIRRLQHTDEMCVDIQLDTDTARADIVRTKAQVACGRWLCKSQASCDHVPDIPYESLCDDQEDKFITVCGRQVSLKEGDDNTLVFTTHGLCAKPEDLTSDDLEDFFANNRSPPNNLTAIRNVFRIASPSSKADPSSCEVTCSYAEAIVSRLSLPMLSHIITLLVKDGLDKAALQIVQLAVKLAPSDALLQSWQNTLQKGVENLKDKAAVLAALQPVQLSNATLMADAARLRYHRGEREEALADLEHLIAMNPEDANCLARKAWMRGMSGYDHEGMVADFRRAEKISPLQDFEYLRLLAEYTSNQDTAYSISLYDRALCAKPASYPARLAYAHIYQQRASCNGALLQFSAAVNDLQLAVKLGLHDADTFMFMSNMYLAIKDPVNAVRQLDKAILEEPEHQAFMIRRAQLMHDLRDRRAAEADFDAAEALGPLPDDVALERQQMHAGTWEHGKRSYKIHTTLQAGNYLGL